MQERKPDMQEDPPSYPKKERAFLPRMNDGGGMPGREKYGSSLQTCYTKREELQEKTCSQKSRLGEVSCVHWSIVKLASC
jgi:hypothetical protein